MFYINQQPFTNVEYRTNIEDPESETARKGTFADSGCGLCSAMMVVDRLTLDRLSMDDAIRLSYDTGANHKVGTDMKLFGPALAEKYDLEMETTDSLEVLEEWLSKGGCAIINVGGNHDDYVGVLSDIGHYVFAFAWTGEEFMILDPAYRPGKYDVEVPAQKGKVYDDGKILYVRPNVIAEDTAVKSPAYYMFRRRRPAAKK